VEHFTLFCIHIASQSHGFMIYYEAVVIAVQMFTITHVYYRTD